MPVYCYHYTDEETETQRLAWGHPDQGHSSEVTALVLATPKPSCLTLVTTEEVTWLIGYKQKTWEPRGASGCALFIFRELGVSEPVVRSPQHPLLLDREPPTTGSLATAGLQRHPNHRGWVLAPRVTCFMTIRKLPPFLNLTSSTVERRLKSSCRVRTVTDGRCHCINCLLN